MPSIPDWRGGTLVAALLLLTAACTETTAPSAPRAITPVKDLVTVPAETMQLTSESVFDGVVEAVNESTVAAQTGGRVTELPFDVGDLVSAGAVIVRLTATEQSARVEAAEGALAETQARLVEADVAYARARDIYARKLIAKAQLDAAAADYQSALARRDSARASISQAREGLSYTVVRAPYAGFVAERHVQPGETVAPGQPLMTGLSLDELRVVVEVPQQHIRPLREHRKARVLLAGNRSIEANTLSIPPKADPVTHTFRVRATLPSGVRDLFPGTLVKVAFVSGSHSRLTLPAGAVVERGELTGVYVLSGDGVIEFRYVRTGAAVADNVVVLAGLSAGERVAADTVAAAIAYKRQRQPADET